MDRVFGLGLEDLEPESTDEELSEEMLSLITEREEARKTGILKGRMRSGISFWRKELLWRILRKGPDGQKMCNFTTGMLLV